MIINSGKRGLFLEKLIDTIELTGGSPLFFSKELKQDSLCFCCSISVISRGIGVSLTKRGFMKVFLGSLVSMMFVTGVAHAAKLDCAKVQNKSVTVDVQSAKEISSLVRAFYGCLENDPVVQQVKQSIVEETNTSGMGDAQQCKFVAPRVLAATSWRSGRYSIYGEAGGEYIYDVSQAYYCSGIGTGLFEGNLSRAQFRVKVVHAERNLEMCAPDACQDQKSSNTVTLSLLVPSN